MRARPTGAHRYRLALTCASRSCAAMRQHVWPKRLRAARVPRNASCAAWGPDRASLAPPTLLCAFARRRNTARRILRAAPVLLCERYGQPVRCRQRVERQRVRGVCWRHDVRLSTTRRRASAAPTRSRAARQQRLRPRRHRAVRRRRRLRRRLRRRQARRSNCAAWEGSGQTRSTHRAWSARSAFTTI